MTEFFGKLLEIYERLMLEMPLFIKIGVEGFISLFLFTLLLFFIFLLLQTTKALLKKAGSRILPFGACLLVLVVIFSIAFSPTPCIGSDGAGYSTATIVNYNGGKREIERNLFISEREKAIQLIGDCIATRSIYPPPSPNETEQCYLLRLTHDDGYEIEIFLTKNRMLIQPLPKTGLVMRCVDGSVELYQYISTLKT